MRTYGLDGLAGRVLAEESGGTGRCCSTQTSQCWPNCRCALMPHISCHDSDVSHKETGGKTEALPSPQTASVSVHTQVHTHTREHTHRQTDKHTQANITDKVPFPAHLLYLPKGVKLARKRLVTRKRACFLPPQHCYHLPRP